MRCEDLGSQLLFHDVRTLDYIFVGGGLTVCPTSLTADSGPESAKESAVVIRPRATLNAGHRANDPLQDLSCEQTPRRSARVSGRDEEDPEDVDEVAEDEEGLRHRRRWMEVEVQGPQPSALWPSDHFAVVANLCFEGELDEEGER